MLDQLNVALEDSVLLEEMDLTVDLIIAASETASQLPLTLVDRLLGVGASGQPSVYIPHPRGSMDPTG